MNEEIMNEIQRLHQKVVSCSEQELYEEAIILAKEALEICRTNNPEIDHPKYIQSLHILATIYQATGNYEEALSLYQEVLKIDDRSPNLDPSKYVQLLNTLASIYKSIGEYEKALKLYRTVQIIYRINKTMDRRSYGNFLNNLALLYEQTGRYVRALPRYKKAVEILGETLGIDHPDYATALNNLGNFYNSMGQYEEALPIYEQVLEIRRQSLGIEHSDYAQSLNNLGTLYQSMGRYKKALPLYEEALKICHKNPEINPSDHALFLNNLAVLYQSMGQYNKAVPLYRKALDIFKNNLKIEILNYAACLLNLATLYQSIEQYGEAIHLTRETLIILSESIGTENHYYAFTLNNLAALHLSMGQYWRAEIIYRQALRILGRTLGNNHPTYAFSLKNLAALHLLMAQYEESENLYRKAIDIFGKRLGIDHPDYASSLSSLACLCVAKKRPEDREEALELMQKAAEINLKTISKIFSISTDNQRLNYLKQNYYELERFLSLVFQNFRNNPEAVQSAYNLILKRKAIATETAILQKIALLSEQYAHLAPILEKLQDIRQQLAKRYFEIPIPEQFLRYRREINFLEQQADNLEGKLNDIPEFNLEKELQEKLQNANFKTIASELPQGTTLIEFVRFNNYNFIAVNDDAAWYPPRYLAFIIPPCRGNPPVVAPVTMIDLGEAEPIDQLVKRFRKSVENGLGLNVIRALDRDTIPEDEIPPKIKLRQLIFDKLIPHLTKELMIGTDGELNSLPFEILPTDKGDYLMNEYRFNFLNVGRDILRFKTKITANITDSLVIANPDYNLGSPENTPSTDEIEEKLPFNPLPGAEIEGETIANALIAEGLNVTVFTSAKALKTHVSKVQKAPYILHISTHGYFFEDINSNVDTINQNALKRLQIGTRQNPLLRSGLAFAGANTWLRGGILPDEAGNGLLTALDIQFINLAGTELVVTSACETALGEIHTGETLIGLRRSFIQAGAKTVIISLWKVDDVATTILMQYFYDYLLKDRLSKAEALREAKSSLQHLTISEMRAQWLTEDAIKWAEKHSLGVAQHLRELSQKSDSDRPYNDPKYWAAFICLGNPAPLAFNSIYFDKLC